MRKVPVGDTPVYKFGPPTLAALFVPTAEPEETAPATPVLFPEMEVLLEESEPSMDVLSEESVPLIDVPSVPLMDVLLDELSMLLLESVPFELLEPESDDVPFEEPCGLELEGELESEPSEELELDEELAIWLACAGLISDVLVDVVLPVFRASWLRTSVSLSTKRIVGPATTLPANWVTTLLRSGWELFVTKTATGPLTPGGTRQLVKFWESENASPPMIIWQVRV